MNYEKFKSALKEAGVFPVYWVLPGKNSWNDSRYSEVKPWDVERYEEGLKTKRTDLVKPKWYEVEGAWLKWEIGGVEGGSCWDDSDPQPYTRSGTEPDFEALEKVVKVVTPLMTFFDYKALYRAVVEFDYYTEHEYYGNQTDYKVKFFKLGKLHEYLRKNKLI
jgi:hypothetical protein